VTVLANGNTGLAIDDVFYFGNAVADFSVGNEGSPAMIQTDATDTSVVRQNQSIAANSVGITNLYDVNKDGRVNASDTSIVRQNQSTRIVRYFAAPASIPLALSLTLSSAIDTSVPAFSVANSIASPTTNAATVALPVARLSEMRETSSSSVASVSEVTSIDRTPQALTASLAEAKPSSSKEWKDSIDQYFSLLGKGSLDGSN